MQVVIRVGSRQRPVGGALPDRTYRFVVEDAIAGAFHQFDISDVAVAINRDTQQAGTLLA